MQVREEGGSALGSKSDGTEDGPGGRGKGLLRRVKETRGNSIQGGKCISVFDAGASEKLGRPDGSKGKFIIAGGEGFSYLLRGKVLRREDVGLHWRRA